MIQEIRQVWETRSNHARKGKHTDPYCPNIKLVVRKEHKLITVLYLVVAINNQTQIK
jgi:hypothetical protein